MRTLIAHGITRCSSSLPPPLDFALCPEPLRATAPLVTARPRLRTAETAASPAHTTQNDNGFDYLVADPYGLRRTSYFPGLGWLLPRAVWEGELAGAWPSSHWDHWMRDPQRSRGRDIVIPEVPRDYHAGVKGTFMDAGTHNKYFGSIAMQADPVFTWDTPAVRVAGGS